MMSTKLNWKSGGETMTYLEHFLDEYIEHIDNSEALYCILHLLPESYQYLFVRNLLKYEKYIIDGDVYEGTKSVGMIKVDSERIVLEGTSAGDMVLLELPPYFDV